MKKKYLVSQILAIVFFKRITIVFILFFALYQFGISQVAYQSNGVGSNCTNCSTITFSDFNVPSGDNRLLVVGTGWLGPSITSIVYKGKALTQAVTVFIFNQYSEIWYVVLGSGIAQTGDLVITLSGNATGFFGVAASYTGVEQSNPIGDTDYAFGPITSNSSSLTLSTTAGNMAVDNIRALSVATVGAGQTEIAQPTDGFAGSYEAASGSNVTMSWTWSDASFQHCAVDLNQVGILPVELTSFQAKAVAQNINLEWQTATETNNYGWDIEHSTEGRNWSVIDFVKSLGNSFDAQNYSYAHNTPVKGINYYRLKQIDYDGNFDYSEIKSVNFNNGLLRAEISVFPNPVTTGTLSLSSLKADFESAFLELFDAQGQIVLTRFVTNQTTSLDVRHLAKGIYWLGMRIDGEPFWKKVVLE